MDDAFQSVTALADECQEFIQRNASPGADLCSLDIGGES